MTAWISNITGSAKTRIVPTTSISTFTCSLFTLAFLSMRGRHHHKSTVYTVQIGPVDSKSGADKLNLQLAKLGITGAQYVTQNDQNGSVMVQ